MEGHRMDAVVIRNYHSEDWPRLQQIHDAARKNELTLAGLEDAFLPLMIAAESEALFDYTVRVAWLGDVAAGFSAFAKGELAWLYVDPSLSRRGIGTQLMRDALEQTGRPVTVEVLAGNEPARQLYERCGFRLIKPLPAKCRVMRRLRSPVIFFNWTDFYYSQIRSAISSPGRDLGIAGIKERY